ncbi:hypothetical protein ACFY2J_38650 [Streptomyces collinus]|uniref:hypothetical protein n=1 Tax=Streptomyces collinus TaxID=42684 RepID=UPI003697291D
MDLAVQCLSRALRGAEGLYDAALGLRGGDRGEGFGQVAGGLRREGQTAERLVAIRRDARAGVSNRTLQRKYGVGFRTVKAAMASVWPEPRKQLPPRKTRLDAFKPVIDQMLRADLDAPRKQRHTVKRIFDRLVDEHGAVEVTYPMVRAYVADRRPQIRIEAGRGPLNAFIPQTHMPGAEAEVDFGDVTIRLAGEQVKVYLFAMRMSYSGKAVHRIFASCGQEAFFEGHVHALSVLGGVPTGKVRYDNLRAAVARVLGLSRARVENERWTAFRSHYVHVPVSSRSLSTASVTSTAA